MQVGWPVYPPLASRHQCASHLQLSTQGAECPINGDCRKKAIVYKANISKNNNDPPKSYYECCETEFNPFALQGFFAGYFRCPVHHM